MKKIQLSGNRWLDSWLLLMGGLGTLHSAVLAVLTVMKRDLSFVDGVTVLDLGSFFPQIKSSPLSLGISFVIFALVYSGIFLSLGRMKSGGE